MCINIFIHYDMPSTMITDNLASINSRNNQANKFERYYGNHIYFYRQLCKALIDVGAVPFVLRGGNNNK